MKNLKTIFVVDGIKLTPIGLDRIPNAGELVKLDLDKANGKFEVLNIETFIIRKEIEYIVYLNRI